ncbi:hypothetical protein F4678DRAFT_485847 [Xylaria arbuscula]|nr:hypothetical protein F4678DRAFT_485847 [Xylaria arbuscula]
MWKLPSARIRTSWGLYHLFFSLAMFLFIYPSPVSAFPVNTASQKDTTALESRENQPDGFAKAFGTAMTIVVLVVASGSIVLCAFAQAWRQILDWSVHDATDVLRKKGKLHKENEAWFCEANSALPMPQFDAAVRCCGARDGAVLPLYSALGSL